MSIIIPANSAVGGGFEVANSLRFNSASSDNLTLSGSSGGSTTKFTRSFWLKKSTLTVQQYLMDNSGETQIFFKLNANDTVSLGIYASSAYSTELVGNTNLMRDPSAWYHIVIAVDYTNATKAYRARIYINNSEVTSFSTETRPNNTSTTFNTFNSSKTHYIGGTSGGSHMFGGYLAEVVHIDGQQLTPSSFGEFDEDSGIWKPINVSGLTFGTKGFYLDFEDSSALGNDVSGNNLDYTANNLTAIDQSTDTCTNNAATWNSLQPTNAAMSEGNLVGASSASSGFYSGFSTIGVTSGKWYFECKQIQESTSNEGVIGVVIFYNTITALLNPEGRGGAWGIKAQGRGFQTDSSGNGSTTNDFIPGFSNNQTIGIALDIDNSKIYFSEGGQWNNSGSWNAANPTTSQTLQNALGDGTYFFFAGDASGSNNCTWSANFGSPAHAISSGNQDGDGYGNFEYAVPSGYFALNTKNLAEYG